MFDTATVLELADAIEPRVRCLVLLGGFTGMRSGELLGLQRRDIDPLHRTVTVERQTSELTGLGRVLTPPTSEAGRRTIALPAVDAFVFPVPAASLLRRQHLSHALTSACAVVGIDGVRPDDLRHHAATVIARNPNVTLRELMATIGHSSHVAALGYQHATAERSREIADYLDGVISAAQPPNRSPEFTTCLWAVAWMWHALRSQQEPSGSKTQPHQERR